MQITELTLLTIVLLLVPREDLLSSCDSEPKNLHDPEVIRLAQVAQCKPLDNRPLLRLCRGTYTLELQTKYKDRHLTVGTQFAIWRMDDKLNKFFLSFHASRMHMCRTLTYNHSGNAFSCAKDKAEVIKYNFDHNEIHCFEFHLRYVDELIRLCMVQDDKTWKKSINDFSALHYTQPFIRMSGSHHISTDTSFWNFILTNLCVFVIGRVLQM